MGKINYKIKSYSQKAVEDEITKLVNEAKQDRKNYHTEKNLLHNEEISFTKIRIDKDYLRYYTENNRTVGDCRHFTQKKMSNFQMIILVTKILIILRCSKTITA